MKIKKCTTNPERQKRNHHWKPKLYSRKTCSVLRMGQARSCPKKTSVWNVSNKSCRYTADVYPESSEKSVTAEFMDVGWRGEVGRENGSRCSARLEKQWSLDANESRKNRQCGLQRVNTSLLIVHGLLQDESWDFCRNLVQKSDFSE